ncbi:hypothetical protein QP166_00330 [Sphingomonas sp. LR60]|uniref:hypothetical protein n=1 Tax=Sphingomonas sp. LR60 TaxID=3050233 RepID=UPI002FE18133
MLAILALYKAKITYDDLVSLMYDNAAIVPDALAEVQEMFIQVERAGDKPLYRLNDLTRAFVLDAAKELDRHDSLKARVQKFVTNVYADSAELSAIVRQVERAVEAAKKGDESALRTTWTSLQQAKSDSVISEDPRFMAACGYVALHLSPPNMADAREYFQNSFKMRHGPELKYVRDWFVAEQRLDGADYHTALINELVSKTREYDDAVRLEFMSRRAVTLYNLASGSVWSEPEKALSRLYESIRLHALGFQATYRDDTKQAYLFQRHFTNSTFLLKNLLMKAGKLDDLIGYLADLTRLPGAKLDPLLGPIREVAASSVEVTRPTEAPRAAGRMLHLGRVLAEADCWLDRAVKDQCVAYCYEAAGQLNKKRSEAKR